MLKYAHNTCKDLNIIQGEGMGRERSLYMKYIYIYIYIYICDPFKGPFNGPFKEPARTQARMDACLHSCLPRRMPGQHWHACSSINVQTWCRHAWTTTKWLGYNCLWYAFDVLLPEMYTSIYTCTITPPLISRGLSMAFATVYSFQLQVMFSFWYLVLS